MNTGKIYKGEYEVFLYKKQDLAKLRRLEAENAQLKKMLKECKPYIGYDTYEFDKKVYNLLAKINQALGEDK